MKPSASESASSDRGPERLDLKLWQSEVREFCEDALRQLQQLTDALAQSATKAVMSVESEAAERVSTRDSAEAKEAARVAERNIGKRSNSTTASKNNKDDNGASMLDSSRSRLESLKRRLSEKLEQSESDSRDRKLPRSD